MVEDDRFTVVSIVGECRKCRRKHLLSHFTRGICSTFGSQILPGMLHSLPSRLWNCCILTNMVTDFVHLVHQEPSHENGLLVVRESDASLGDLGGAV
jgi:hypothetical protein